MTYCNEQVRDRRWCSTLDCLCPSERHLVTTYIFPSMLRQEMAAWITTCSCRSLLIAASRFGQKLSSAVRTKSSIRVLFFRPPRAQTFLKQILKRLNNGPHWDITMPRDLICFIACWKSRIPERQPVRRQTCCCNPSFPSVPPPPNLTFALPSL